jgi:hypothetical protein
MGASEFMGAMMVAGCNPLFSWLHLTQPGGSFWFLFAVFIQLPQRYFFSARPRSEELTRKTSPTTLIRPLRSIRSFPSSLLLHMLRPVRT